MRVVRRERVVGVDRYGRRAWRAVLTTTWDAREDAGPGRTKDTRDGEG